MAIVTAHRRADEAPFFLGHDKQLRVYGQLAIDIGRGVVVGRRVGKDLAPQVDHALAVFISV
jgi:hypothetical protein